MEISKLMRKRIVVLGSLFFMIIGGCRSGNALQQLEWMLGNWQYVTPEGTFVEHWQKNEQGFSGHGWYIVNEDTLFQETLSVTVKNGGIYYIAQVAGQNADKPVEFMLTGLSRQLVFENPSHDFPKKITYSYHDDDHITATIEGVEKGKSRVEELKFTKVR
jgi:hypothetical protein